MPDMAAEYEAGRLSNAITRFFATKCGIETSKKTDVGKRKHAVVTAHSFRHTFISKAAAAGIPFAIVQAIVGHSTAKQCRHYFHENEDATLRAFAAFPTAQTAPALPDRTGGDAGDVIEAEVVEVTDATAETRRAALEAALAEILRHGDEAAPRAVFAPLRETPRHAILSTFFGKADGKSKTRTANPKKQFAPCAIGLPFAGIFDPVTQGVFHT